MTRLMLAVLLFFPSLASAFEFPSLHNVYDVAPNDVLNVRSGPSVEHPIISSFTYDQKHIEVIRLSESGRWALVNVGEGTGWAASRFLKPLSLEPRIPTTMRCFGTEPFWRADLWQAGADQRIDLQVLGSLDQTILAHAGAFSSGRSDRFGYVAYDRSAILSVSAQLCSDGMSDRAFGMSADVFVETISGWQQFSGCCSLAP